MRMNQHHLAPIVLRLALCASRLAIPPIRNPQFEIPNPKFAIPNSTVSPVSLRKDPS